MEIVPSSDGDAVRLNETMLQRTMHGADTGDILRNTSSLGCDHDQVRSRDVKMSRRKQVAKPGHAEEYLTGLAGEARPAQAAICIRSELARLVA